MPSGLLPIKLSHEENKSRSFIEQRGHWWAFKHKAEFPDFFLRKGLEGHVCGKRRDSKFCNLPPTYQESILPTPAEFPPECGRLPFPPLGPSQEDWCPKRRIWDEEVHAREDEGGSTFPPPWTWPEGRKLTEEKTSCWIICAQRGPLRTEVPRGERKLDSLKANWKQSIFPFGQHHTNPRRSHQTTSTGEVLLVRTLSFSSILLSSCFARSQSALQRGAGWLTWGRTGGSMCHSQIPGGPHHQWESGGSARGEEQQRPAECQAQNWATDPHPTQWVHAQQLADCPMVDSSQRTNVRPKVMLETHVPSRKRVWERGILRGWAFVQKQLNYPKKVFKPEEIGKFYI